MTSPSTTSVQNDPTTSPPDISIDQSSLKKVAESVYKQNIELVRLDEMKDEFVAIVSHELRTPLTIIKNYLWLVVNKDKDQVGPDAMSKVRIAIQSVDRLMSLVEDTLTISRIENEKIVLKRETLDIVARVKYITEIYASHAQEQNIRIVLNSKLEKLEVNADTNRFHEVIVNLLSNAIKFSPPNHPITITIESVAENGAQIARVSIRDEGPGISKEHQEKLFTKFGKIDESYANLPNVNGTGLGLYISQEIMKLHGGSISVESDYGHGATFIVSLPISE